MARINITKTAVKAELEKYRGSRKINPYDEEAAMCRNYMHGRRCIVSQVLSNLGVSDDDLKAGEGGASHTLRVLHDRKVITKRSLDLGAWLNALQNVADGIVGEPRRPWGQVVAEVDNGTVDALAKNFR